VPRPYSSVNLTPEALDRLRRVTLTASAELGRRVPMSDTVTALTRLAERHGDELAALLRDPTPDPIPEG
jgi:hypothetical protein